MKTINQIKQSISDLTEKQDMKYYSKNSPSESLRISKYVSFYRDCITYLESNPTEEFLKKEIDRIKNMIEVKTMTYSIWFAMQNDMLMVEPMQRFKQDMEIDKLETQLFTLIYLYY